MFRKIDYRRKERRGPRCFALSALLALLFVGLYLDVVASVAPAEIPLRIEATGEKNELSQGFEVWVLEVRSGDKPISLEPYANESWALQGNGLVSIQPQPAVLDLSVPLHGDDISVMFLSHSYSGSVNITINGQATSQDLFSEQPTNWIFSNTSFSMLANLSVSSILYMVLLILLLCVVFGGIFYFFTAQKAFFSGLAGCLFAILLMNSPFLNYWDSLTKTCLVVVIGFSAVRLALKPPYWLFTITSTIQKIVLPGILLYATAAAAYNKVFFPPRTQGFCLQIPDICFILLSFMLATLLCLAFLADFHNFRKWISTKTSGEKTKRELRLMWGLLFAIVLIGYSFWIIASAPANMSYDSHSIWQQAIGASVLQDWHPIFYTLLVRLSALIIESPIMPIIAQTILQAAIWATGGILLWRRGIPRFLIIVSICTVAILPNNGVMAATLWKDVAYSIAMLALVVSLAQITTRKQMSRIQAAMLIVALLFTAQIRHNGMVPVVITAIVLSLFYLRKLQRLIPVLAIVSIVLIKNVIIPAFVIEAPSDNNLSMGSPLHDIGGIMVQGGEIKRESRQLLTELVPEEVWLEEYAAYIADPYAFSTAHENGPVLRVLESMDKTTLIKIYAEIFFQNPLSMMDQRLTNADINWSISTSPSPEAYLYRSAWVPSEQMPNYLTPVAHTVILQTTAFAIADIVLWRSGLYLIMLSLLAYYAWVFGFGKCNLVMVPLVTNFLFMFLGTNAQDYRYGYLIFLVFPFILLFYASEPPTKDVLERYHKNAVAKHPFGIGQSYVSNQGMAQREVK